MDELKVVFLKKIFSLTGALILFVFVYFLLISEGPDSNLFLVGSLVAMALGGSFYLAATVGHERVKNSPYRGYLVKTLPFGILSALLTALYFYLLWNYVEIDLDRFFLTYLLSMLIGGLFSFYFHYSKVLRKRSE